MHKTFKVITYISSMLTAVYLSLQKGYPKVPISDS